MCNGGTVKSLLWILVGACVAHRIGAVVGICMSALVVVTLIVAKRSVLP